MLDRDRFIFSSQDLVIVSGGQTGVDRAALEAAKKLSFQFGGYAPRGWLTEEGLLPKKYRFSDKTGDGLLEDKAEVDSMREAYTRRTKRNVEESDATLILTRGPMRGGTDQTFRFCRAMRKPFNLIKVDNWKTTKAEKVAAWIARTFAKRLNVAGPRESRDPGIHDLAFEILCRVLEEVSDTYP